MTAYVTHFALLGRSTPVAAYEALRSKAPVAKARVRTRTEKSGRWTGNDEVVERPARFAA